MQTKFSKVENRVRFYTRSHTAREMYVDSQMGIITITVSPGQASVPEDAAQLQLKKTSSEDMNFTGTSLQNKSVSQTGMMIT